MFIFSLVNLSLYSPFLLSEVQGNNVTNISWYVLSTIMCKYSTMRRVGPIYTRKTWRWKGQLFPSPISPVVSQLLEVFHLPWNYIWYAQGQADLTLWCCTSLHWFSAPVFTQPPREWELWRCFKTASPTKDNRQSLREQHTENHFPSFQRHLPRFHSRTESR